MQTKSERLTWWRLSSGSTAAGSRYGDDDLMLERICRRVAQDMGDGVTDEKLARTRVLIDAATMGRKALTTPRWNPGRWLAAAAAIVAVIAVVVFNRLSEGEALRFWVGTNGYEGRLNQLIRATSDEPVSISFERDSRLVLHKDTVARVMSASSKSVTVELQRGSLDAAIVRGAEAARWEVRAGGCAVVVLGTTFNVTWNEQDESLLVAVEKGLVSIEASNIDEEGFAGSLIKVPTGYQFEMNRRKNRFAWGKIGDSPGVTAAIQSEQSAEDVDPVPSPPPSEASDAETIEKTIEKTKNKKNGPRRRRPGHAKSPAPSIQSDPAPLENDEMETDDMTWLERYEDQDYPRAMAAAEKVGISKLIRTSDLEDLWRLVDVARKTQRYEVAKQALLACRKRFAGTNQAEISAFILGKIYYEDTPDLDRAVGWFSTYLKENPTGRLAEGAQARMMSAFDRMGKRDAARRAASRYLKDYPNGEFSDTARDLTE